MHLITLVSSVQDVETKWKLASTTVSDVVTPIRTKECTMTTLTEKYLIFYSLIQQASYLVCKIKTFISKSNNKLDIF